MADHSGSWAVSRVLADGGCNPNRRSSGRILDWWWGSNPSWSGSWWASGGSGVGAWAVSDSQGSGLSNCVGLSNAYQQ